MNLYELPERPLDPPAVKFDAKSYETLALKAHNIRAIYGHKGLVADVMYELLEDDDFVEALSVALNIDSCAKNAREAANKASDALYQQVLALAEKFAEEGHRVVRDARP